MDLPGQGRDPRLNPKNMPEDEPLPDRIRAELERMPDPTDEELARYDYLKADFLQALRLAAVPKAQRSDPSRPGIVDAVFSLTGDLLRWAEEQVRNLSQAGRTQAVPIATRGVEATGQSKPKQDHSLIGKVCKQQGDFFIEAATYKLGEMVEMEINVVHRTEGSEVRPLDITVTDQEGRVISGPVHVGKTGQAPRFPGPAAGIYRFLVSWPGNSGEIQIEFRQQCVKE
jgi:hypothetical protein